MLRNILCVAKQGWSDAGYPASPKRHERARRRGLRSETSMKGIQTAVSVWATPPIGARVPFVEETRASCGA
jgi:hypothetical protein